jgi:hypothetical protein
MFVQALIALAIAGLIVGGVVLLLRKKTLPLPPLPFLKVRSPEELLQEEAALMDLAQRAVSRYPELGSTPAELRTEIGAYCKGIHSWSGRTPRIILEKILEAGSLEKAMSYWQVREFLLNRNQLRNRK